MSYDLTVERAKNGGYLVTEYTIRTDAMAKFVFANVDKLCDWLRQREAALRAPQKKVKP